MNMVCFVAVQRPSTDEEEDNITELDGAWLDMERPEPAQWLVEVPQETKTVHILVSASCLYDVLCMLYVFVFVWISSRKSLLSGGQQRWRS